MSTEYHNCNRSSIHDLSDPVQTVAGSIEITDKAEQEGGEQTIDGIRLKILRRSGYDQSVPDKQTRKNMVGQPITAPAAPMWNTAAKDHIAEDIQYAGDAAVTSCMVESPMPRKMLPTR